MKVEHECGDCGGTGVYSGMCEGKGKAVICLGCDGSGKAVSIFRAFTGRKRRKGIKTVYNSRGRFIVTGVGPVPEKSVTYAAFLKGERP